MIYVLLGFILALFLGYCFTFLLLKSASSWERGALSPALGFGAVSFLLLILFSFELLITKTQLISILAGFCLILVMIYRKEVFLIKVKDDYQGDVIQTGYYLPWIVLVLLFGVSFLFSTTFPIFISDGNDYEATGRLIALNRAIEQEYYFRPYAPFVPLIYSFVYFLGGTHPKIIFSLFYLSLIGLFYISMKNETGNLKLSIIFTGVIASTPFLWWHSYLGLLNLTAGYFFTLGCLYFIRCLDNQEHIGELIISGVGFGLATFTRFEYLVYFIAPFLIFIFQKNKGIGKVLAFSIFALLPSTLWNVFKETGFIGGGGIYATEETLMISAFWGGIILYAARSYIVMLADFSRQQRVKRLFFFGLMVFILFAVVVLYQLKGTVFPSLQTSKIILQTGACVVFRLLAGNIFWMFTFSLLCLLIFKSFREALRTKKLITTSLLIGVYYLLHICVYTYHIYSHDPTSAHPYHASLLANLKWVFLTPGSFFNTSEVRDLLAINPLIIFLCGQVCYIAKIRERGGVLLSRFLIIVICLNIITLTIVFLYPRLAFLYEYRNASSKEILLSPGPRDNPNMEHLRRIYKFLYFVKEHSEEDSIIYFINPHTSKPQAYKVLLPRTIRFINQEGNNDVIISNSQVLDGKRCYLVFRKGNIPSIVGTQEIIWNDAGWAICRFEAKN
jgi:hypothetical protein